MSNEKSVRNSLKILSKLQILIKSSYGAKIAKKGAIPVESFASNRIMKFVKNKRLNNIQIITLPPPPPPPPVYRVHCLNTCTNNICIIERRKRRKCRKRRKRRKRRTWNVENVENVERRNILLVVSNYRSVY